MAKKMDLELLYFERVEGVSAALDLPANRVPLCVILIGYPAENPTPKDKWKPENVTYM